MKKTGGGSFASREEAGPEEGRGGDEGGCGMGTVGVVVGGEMCLRLRICREEP